MMFAAQRKDLPTADITVKAIVFATVAFIVTQAAEIQEYNDAAARRAYNPAVEAKRAELVNPNIKQRFILSEVPQYDAFLIEPGSVISNTESQDENPCGPWLGIKLNDGQRYICNVTRFVVETYENFRRVMYFQLHFESDTTPLVTIDIPVFKIPSSVASLSSDDLSEWARQNHVGLKSPVDEDQLTNLRQSNQLTLNFTWLSELLPYELRDSRQTLIETLISRPILLADDMINKLVNAVNWFKYEACSDEADDLSRLDGMAELNIK